MNTQSNQTTSGNEDLKSIIEALLFVADKSLTVEQIREVAKVDIKVVKDCLKEMKAAYEEMQGGFVLSEIAGGYQFVTNSRYADYIREYALNKEKRKLSTASLETLSIIAYKQPITRQEIEYIRGVNVDGAVRALTEKGLIRISGRKDAPGRPLLYSTTKDFLDHFGLAGIKELPQLAEFKEGDLDLPDSITKPSETTESEGSAASESEAMQNENEVAVMAENPQEAELSSGETKDES